MPDRDRERDGCIGLFASYLLAFIVLVIGFSCPYWIWDKSEGAEYHTGLWRSCTVDADDDMDCKSIDLSEQEDWYKTVAAFMIVALSLGVFGGALSIWNPLSASLQIGAGAFGLAGTIWYAIENEHIQDGSDSKLHWAYWLSFIGSVLLFLNGIGLLILSIKQRCSMRRQMPWKSSDVGPV